MELRVIERDGKRWLQQYRHPPDGALRKYVAELPWPPSNRGSSVGAAIGRGEIRIVYTVPSR